MNAEIIEKLKAAVGEKYVLTEDEATKPFLVDWTKRFVGKAVVVRPANTEEVSRVVRIANETRTPRVPIRWNACPAVRFRMIPTPSCCLSAV